MSDKNILVVDDNAANLKLAKVLLLTEGYVVRTASDAPRPTAHAPRAQINSIKATGAPSPLRIPSLKMRV